MQEAVSASLIIRCYSGARIVQWQNTCFVLRKRTFDSFFGRQFWSLIHYSYFIIHPFFARPRGLTAGCHSFKVEARVQLSPGMPNSPPSLNWESTRLVSERAQVRSLLAAPGFSSAGEVLRQHVILPSSRRGFDSRRPHHFFSRCRSGSIGRTPPL